MWLYQYYLKFQIKNICNIKNQLNKSLPVSFNVCDVNLSISLSKCCVSGSISDWSGLACNEFWTLSHSNEFIEETLDQSESVPFWGTELWTLDSLGQQFVDMSWGRTVQVPNEWSFINDTGSFSCSHSKSKELAGVDVLVLANNARASKYCNGISLLLYELQYVWLAKLFIRETLFFTKFSIFVANVIHSICNMDWLVDLIFHQPIPRLVSTNEFYEYYIITISRIYLRFFTYILLHK